MKINDYLSDIKNILLVIFSLLLGVFSIVGGIKIAPGFALHWGFALVTIFQFVGFALLLAVIIWPLVLDAPAGILKILFIVMGILGILSFVFWLFTPFGWLTLSVVWFLWIELFAGIAVVVLSFLALKE